MANSQWSVFNSLMPIKFYCSCGKHLRAREALAGKRTMCPTCGRIVGVPSLHASQRGAIAGPLTPAERAQLGRPASGRDDAFDALKAILAEAEDAAEEQQPRRRRSRRM